MSGTAFGLRLLSVVVIGRNEGERLRRCLASVQAMQRGPWDVELLYVDSGSQDDSVALAKQMGARTLSLPVGQTTAAMGRNAGWREAAGEVLLFLDGDTELHPEFVKTALAELADSDVAVVWGHRRESQPKASVYNRVLDLDWIYAPGRTPFCGGDALMRRDVLEDVGGFDATLIAGEEPELCCRILARGKVVLHVDRAMTSHDLAMTRLVQYVRRAMRAGHAYAEVSHRFAQRGDGFWGEEVRSNRLRALCLFGGTMASVAAAARLRSVWPIVLGLVVFAALSVRSAYKARWKSKNAGTLLLYGVHSHMQQLPIFVGQMQFFWGRWRGVRRKILEYKGL